MSIPKLPKKGAVKYLSRLSKLNRIKRKLYRQSLYHYELFNKIEARLVRLDYLQRIINERHNKANS